MDGSKKSWKYYFQSYIPILILLLVFSLSIAAIIQVNYIRNLSETVVNDLTLEADLFRNDISNQTNNLLYLSDILTRIYDNITDKESFQRLATESLFSFVSVNLGADQIRFLNPDGMENIRINRQGNRIVVVPENLLQNKNNRYYYQNVLDFDAGEVYVSKFDLNVEYEIIETPFKPVYRLITPVDASNGTRIGYVVLNIYGKNILERIRSAEEIFPGNLNLINDEGYWLTRPENTNAWGFMFQRVQNSTIAETFPVIWNRYNGEDLYQGFCSNGLFTFWVVDPVNEQNSSFFHSHEKWIFVSHIQPGQLISTIAAAVTFTAIGITIVLSLSFKQAAKNRVNEMKAYHAQEESKKKFDIISNASQDAIILINSEGLIDYWSQSAERLFGYKSAEVIGQEVHKIIAMHQSDRDMAEIGLKKFSKTGKGSILEKLREVDAKTKSGKLIPVEISISSIKIDNQWWAAGIVRDIRDRKRTEKKIRELALFPLENTNPVMRVDKNGVILYANPASVHLLKTWKVKVNEKISASLRSIIQDAIINNEKKEKRVRIRQQIFLFDIFPVSESGYANIYGLDITQEEKTRKELESSELKYRSLLNTVPQFIFHKDREGRYVTINEALSRFMEKDASEVIGKTDFDLFPEDVAKIHRKSDLEVLESGSTVEFDQRYYPDKETDRYTHMVKSPIFNSRKQVVGVLGIFWEITNRVEAERRLSELNKNLEALVKERTKEIEVINQELSISEKRYRAIIENQVEYVFRWDLNGIITYSNRSFSNRFKNNKKDIVGKFYKDIISSEGMDKLFKQTATFNSKKPLQTVEIQDELTSGKKIWEQWNSRAIFNEKNEIVEIQNVGRDITALKQAQEQVYIQSSALEAAANGIVITDNDGTIVWVNQAISRLTGYGIQELVGKNPRIFKSGELDKRIYKDLWQTITSGKVWTGEMINRKKDGSIYTEEMTITPVSTKKGNVTGYIAIKQDITARKEIEKEIKDAKEQAELANSAKSTFLANMSHEIRTPLNAIMGLNYLLKRTGVSETQEKYLDKMQSASKTLLDTINDVLDFSKIEAEKIEIENVPFDMESILVEIADTEALKAHQKNLELLVNMEEGLPERVEGDPIRLKQILRNLTNNAVKFTESGDVSIGLKKVKENKKNIIIQFSVADTGIGLSQEQIEGLFAPFQQADISTTRKYGGSGLGLAISKRIVELMNGQIWVESDIGKGSTFYFNIPFKKVPPKKKADIFTSKEVIGKKVLIVDSNMKSYQWLAQLLKPTQAEITYVADTQTLDEILSQENGKNQFQAVIINNNVQGFRRLDDLVGLKKRLSPNAKVIHLTDTIQFAKRIQESGSDCVDAVLIKPINASQLYNSWIKIFKDKISTAGKSKKTLLKVGVGDYLKNIEILLVEDNEINQEVITELLSHAGAKITIAENGLSVLDLIKHNKFDLILMDVQMPVMDGFSTTVEIRKDRGFDSLPIIALTANAQVAEKKKALDIGMNDYITKPIEPRVLFNTINKWVGKEAISDKGAMQVMDSKPILEIRGINTNKGLQRLNNDVNAYITLLEKFVKNHAKDISHAKQLITQEDWVNASAAIHAERGAAANLGAEILASSLGEIEASIKANDQDASLKELNRAIKLFKEIESGIQALEIDPVIEKTKQLRQLSIKELLDKLIYLEQRIKENDPRSKVIIYEINESNPDDKYSGSLLSVQNFLDVYDFENARATTKKVIEIISGENND